MGHIDALQPSAFGLEGGVDPSVDPQQQYGVKGVMPQMPAKKLQEERTLRSNHLGFQSQYELLATEAYLKANSAEPSQPLTIFKVRTKVLDVYTKTRCLYQNATGRLYGNFIGAILRRLACSIRAFVVLDVCT